MAGPEAGGGGARGPGLLEPGSLWRVARERTRAALESGALLPIDTTARTVEDRGVAFSVRTVSSLARKRRQAAEPGGPEEDPFLHPEGDLVVGDLPPRHRCLLNKFNVLADHLLIVTREFEDQERLLTAGDLEALWTCMAEADALGFYNGGVVAGASQAHKHLQLVPLPIDGGELPIEPLLAQAPRAGGLVVAPGLPFAHRLAWVPGGLVSDPEAVARWSHETYLEMASALGVAEPGGATPDARQLRPYNLLATRRWLLLVPRSVERFEGISVNAIGFAGGLLVRDRAEAEAVVRAGPMAVLEHVGVRG